MLEGESLLPAGNVETFHHRGPHANLCPDQIRFCPLEGSRLDLRRCNVIYSLWSGWVCVCVCLCGGQEVNLCVCICPLVYLAFEHKQSGNWKCVCVWDWLQWPNTAPIEVSPKARCWSLARPLLPEACVDEKYPQRATRTHKPPPTHTNLWKAHLSAWKTLES